MFKRIFIIVFIVSIFSFTGCNSNDSIKSTKNHQGKGIEKPAIEVFHNKNARMAVAHAIDKEYIEKVVLGDGSVEADYIVAKGYCFDENGNDFRLQNLKGYYHYDENKAKEYWNKAKEEVGFEKTKAKFLVYDDEGRRKVAEYIQSQLIKNLEGLEVVMDIQPFKNKVDMAKKGEWDIDFGGWGGSYPDPQTYLELFYNGYSLNFGQYVNNEYSKIIDDAKFGDLAVNPEKRWTELNRAEKILLEEDIAVVPIAQVGTSMLVKSNIKNFKVLPAYQGEYMFRFIEKITNEERSIVKTIATLDLPTVDPTMSNATQSSTVLANIMEGLTQIDEGGSVKLAGAKSYDISENGLKYIFYLREDAKWQNGEEVTAYDYEFSWKRLANPDTGSDMSTLLGTAGIKNAQQVIKGEADVNDLGIRAVDKYTFEVELDVPVAFFLRLIAKPTFSPINEKFYNAHKEKYATTVEDTLSNGAYIMETWEYGYGYSIVKNELYWDKNSVKNDGASFRILKDTSAAVNLYNTGEIDIVPITGEFVNSYSESDEMVQFVKPRTYWIHFNFREK